MKIVQVSLVCLIVFVSWVRALYGQCKASEECKPIAQCPHERSLPRAQLQRLTFCGYLLEHTTVCCRRETTPNSLRRDPKDHRNLNLINNPEICGISFSIRVKDGQVASVNQFPWLVLLEYRTSDYEQTSFGCGGSLISSRYVLTAAHCRSTTRMTLFSVRLGEHSKTQKLDCTSPTSCNPPPEDITIDLFIQHDEFNSADKLNDIALIRLSRPVSLSKQKENVRTICLPVEDFHQIDSADKAHADRLLTIAGWGETEDAQSSDVPKFAFLDYQTNDECIAILLEKKKNPINQFIRSDIHATQMCAGGSVAADACKGDSGSVLSGMSAFRLNKASRNFQYGIVSYGVNCKAKEAFPGVFTRVSSYMNWILDHMTE